jgi:cell division protein FtsZ
MGGLNFEIIDNEDNDTVIKVIGVGGAGGNAVEHMIRAGVQGVEFITANTDSQALNRSQATVKLALGKLGAGGKPEVGRQAAETHRDDIRAVLEGANMAFITAGMGGGTGTGAAPVVAQVAKELGILTVGVVTKPFTMEGGKRMKNAEAGIAEFSKHVDSLIVVLNDKLLDVLGDDAEFEDCMHAADDVLKNAVGGIAEIITNPGIINVDFEDVRTVMGEVGRAMMGSGSAVGEGRAEAAAKQAVASPLLEGVNLSNAKGILVNITAKKTGLKMKEVHEVMNAIRGYAAEEAHIIMGSVFDENMGDALRVTVVATGLGQQGKVFKVISTPVETETEVKATGTYGGGNLAPTIAEYDAMDTPAVARRRPTMTAQTLATSGMDQLEIPAFLRRQAD